MDRPVPSREAGYLTLERAYRAYRFAKTPLDRDRYFQVVERAVQPLIEGIASRYSGRRNAKDDLRQVARLGLLRALDTWRPDAGRLLKNHIHYEMTMAVLKYLEQNMGNIHVPIHLQKSRRNIERTRECLFNVLGREATDAEVLAEAKDRDTYVSWLHALKYPKTTEEFLGDAQIVTTDNGFEDCLLSNLTVEKWLQILSPNQRMAVVLRYLEGIEDYDEFYAITGWSTKRVGNTLYQARNNLRRHLSGHVDDTGRIMGPRGVRI